MNHQRVRRSVSLSRRNYLLASENLGRTKRSWKSLRGAPETFIPIRHWRRNGDGTCGLLYMVPLLALLLVVPMNGSTFIFQDPHLMGWLTCCTRNTYALVWMRTVRLFNYGCEYLHALPFPEYFCCRPWSMCTVPRSCVYEVQTLSSILFYKIINQMILSKLLLCNIQENVSNTTGNVRKIVG